MTHALTGWAKQIGVPILEPFIDDLYATLPSEKWKTFVVLIKAAHEAGVKQLHKKPDHKVKWLTPIDGGRHE